MASVSPKGKRASEQTWSSRSSSLQTSPNVNVSLTSVQETEVSFSRRLINSLLNSSYEECSRDERFDKSFSNSVALPKTDYTYARSGSYSPRHLRKKYVNPNMSRRRLRGMVTPPVSMMMDDSDSDMDVNEQVDYSENLRSDTVAHSSSVSGTQFSHASMVTANNHASSYLGLHTADQLDFDSDSADIDSGEAVVSGGGGDRMYSKEMTDKENLQIQQSGQGLEYRHYYGGMVLRSGSHLKGVKRFLDSQEANRRRTTSSINYAASAEMASNSLAVPATPVTGMLADRRQRRQSDNAANYGAEYTTTTTTTVTKTVTELEDEELNTNNNARMRRSSRSPPRTRLATRGKTAHYSESDYSVDTESKRISDEHQKEKNHRVNHMYGLDETDDFSDADTYSYTSSSFGSADGFVAADYGASKPKKNRKGFVAKSFLFVTTVVTTIIDSISRVTKPVMAGLWAVTLGPVFGKSPRPALWLWRKITKVARYFILLDAWMLNRNTRRGFCLCVPLLLFLPFLFGGSYYVAKAVSRSRSFIAFPPLFFSQQTTNIRQGDTLQTINLHHEVKQILMQIQSEKRDWLSRTEIEKLVRGMLNPEIESLRVTLLNVAKEGEAEQARSKLDHSSKEMRLTDLEQKMAALQTKAKLLEGELKDSSNQFVGTLTGDRNKYAADYASLERGLADLRAQLDALQGAYVGLASHSKKCCINDSALVAAIRDNVNLMLTEMFGKDGKGRGSGGTAFTGWLNQNFVDRSEFEQQLRLLTVDITNKISAGIQAQQAGHTSSFVLPPGAGELSEEAVKLIVEDALLKYSADRTGLPDYALESAGGSVLSVRCSKTYYRKTALISVFGIPLWYTSNSPRTVIQPDVNPGQCWAFKGKSGFVVIQLSVPIRPTAFSLEHIPKSLSTNGSIDSAPNHFTVFGLASETDTNGVNLGNFTYQSVGKPIQQFDVQIRNPGIFGFVELRILDNHGNEEYTCLYRFRVHGVPQS